MESPRSLDGIFVVDLSRVLAGPLVGNDARRPRRRGDQGRVAAAATTLAHWMPPVDARVARPTTTRRTATSARSSSTSSARRTSSSRAALCERADVVVANFKPGTLERFGLGYEAVVGRQPRVVYCEISGFGERARPRPARLRPARPGGRRPDEHHGAARHARRRRASRSSTSSPRSTRRSACSAALYARERERPRPARDRRSPAREPRDAREPVDRLARRAAGPGPPRQRSPSIEPFATYRAEDGELMVAPATTRQFARLAEAIGAPELADDPRFSSNEAEIANREELRPLLEEHLGARPVPSGATYCFTRAFRPARADDRRGILARGEPRTRCGRRHRRRPHRQLSRRAVGDSGGTRRRPPELDEHGAEIRADLREPGARASSA